MKLRAGSSRKSTRQINPYPNKLKEGVKIPKSPKSEMKGMTTDCGKMHRNIVLFFKALQSTKLENLKEVYKFLENTTYVS